MLIKSPQCYIKHFHVGKQHDLTQIKAYNDAFHTIK